MTQLIALLENIVCIPLYLLALLIPKNPRLWVFGAWFGHRYSDNPRYIYEYINEHEPEIRAVWLSRDKQIVKELRAKGYEAYGVKTFKGFCFSCRAAVVFVCSGQTDINLVASGAALKVQLWHGIPLKKIKADDDKSRYNTSGTLFRFFRWFWMRIFAFDRERWDLLVTSGPEMTRRMTSAFNGFMSDKGQVVELGNPRADRILSTPDPAIMEPFKKPFPVEHIVCYAPTFRGKSAELKIFESLDCQELERTLQKWNALLLIKLHFYDRNRVSVKEFPSRVHFVTEEELADINLLLPHTDVLITDYSSVFFDFLLLNRPILFAPFDIESYIKDERGLFEPYSEATPGAICMNWSELIENIDLVFKGSDEYRDKRIFQTSRFFNKIDCDNSKRITSHIKDILKF